MWNVTIPQSTMSRLDKRTTLEKRVEMAFSRAQACLKAFGSETIDTNLGKVYSKTGLVDATADKLLNKMIKSTITIGKQESTLTKTLKTKIKTQQRAKLRPLEEILQFFSF